MDQRTIPVLGAILLEDHDFQRKIGAPVLRHFSRQRAQARPRVEPAPLEEIAGRVRRNPFVPFFLPKADRRSARRTKLWGTPTDKNRPYREWRP